MQVTIKDSFELQKIANSGQCFRVKEFGDGWYRFITGKHVLYIKRENHCRYSVSCTPDEWDSIWYNYFDLQRNYACIKNAIPDNDVFLKRAYFEGQGIRILQQDHWETLITFIISQRKSIPAIKQSVELLAEAYGNPIRTPFETVNTFPSASALRNVSLADLRNIKVGYRDKYLLSAIEKISSGSICLTKIEELSDNDLLDTLCQIQGVGTKVANCVCLFSYGRTTLAPIDTWIKKVIDAHYNGNNPFPSFGMNAGIMQQYIFNYSIQHKGDFNNG